MLPTTRRRHPRAGQLLTLTTKLVLELVVDDALEGLEGLSARQKSAIDEKGGRCIYAEKATLLIVGPDRLAKLSRVEALVERL